MRITNYNVLPLTLFSLLLYSASPVIASGILWIPAEGIEMEISQVEDASSINDTFIWWTIKNRTTQDLDFITKYYTVINGNQYEDSRFGKALAGASVRTLMAIKGIKYQEVFDAKGIRIIVEFENRNNKFKNKKEFIVDGWDLKQYFSPK
jgi:hypothetical protein